MAIAHRLNLPHPRYLRTIVQRTVVMWVLLRLLIFVFLFMVVGLEAAAHQPAMGIPSLLVWLDRRIFREELLPANLGAAEGWFWAFSLTTALALDIVAEILLRQL